LRFTGHRQQANGFQHVGARDRLPATLFPAFIESDPIGLAGSGIGGGGGVNTFPYGGNNPYKNIDPSGLFMGSPQAVATTATAAEIGGAGLVVRAIPGVGTFLWIMTPSATESEADDQAPRIAYIASTTDSQQQQRFHDNPGLNQNGKSTPQPTPGSQCKPPEASRPQGIPESWQSKPTNSPGIEYFDPTNPGNSVRIMQGDPNSQYPNSRAPYVRWQVNGQPLDAQGNVLPTARTPDAHIPLQNFRFIPGVYK
jgi:RHS repeat-associated protein